MIIECTRIAHAVMGLDEQLRDLQVITPTPWIQKHIAELMDALRELVALMSGQSDWHSMPDAAKQALV